MACHSQPICVVTATVKLPPNAGTDWLCGASVAEHGTCVTVNVCPAMVSVPVRVELPVDDTSNLTDPLPVPLLPESMSSQPTFSVAVHAHPEPADTATVRFWAPWLPTVI